MKLNLGCEYEYKKDWVNLDFNPEIKADVHWDLNKYPYPFKDNQFDEILASAILEHLDDFEKAMKELYRIGKDGCKIYILLPHASEIINTWGDIEHKRGYTYSTFGDAWGNRGYYPMFEVIKRKLVFTRVNYAFLNPIINPIINLFPNFYERMLSGILPCSLVVFILKVRKDKVYQYNNTRKMIKDAVYIDNKKFIEEI